MTTIVTTDDGAALAVETRGRPSAPALMFLNSIGCDRRLWDAQTQKLADERYCISFDARGHGDSDAPGGGYTIARLGQDALQILDALHIERADLCGLSLGGVTAQWLAMYASQRVGRLVLANTASRIGSADAWQARLRLVREEGLEAIADMAMERFFSELFRRDHPDVVARFRATLVATPAQGYAGCCAALRDADLSPEVGRIAAPTLVIGGQDDVSTPVAQARALAAAIAGARLAILPAAHLSNIECPDAFTQALANHLESR